MADSFEGMATGISGPASNAVSVTPGSDALAFIPRAIYVGGSGDLAVTMAGGGNVTFASVAGGSILPVRVSHVLGASTATGIVTIW